MTAIHITNFTIAGGIIAALIGFGFRFGLECKELGKFPKFFDVFLLVVFSFGTASLMFLYIISKEIKIEIKLISICASSFFGSVLVPGVGAIKPSFFTAIAKDLLRKLVNGQYSTNTNNNDTITDTKNETDSEVSQTSEIDRDLEQ